MAHPRRSPRRLHAGFTLVEVLVALLVMAIMATMAWRGLDALMQSRDIAQRHLEQSTRLQTVIAQWEQDLRAMQAAPDQAVQPLSFDGATLRIARQQPGGMQIVNWTVRNGALMRWEGPVVQTVAALLESAQRGQQLVAQDAVQLRALEGASSWQIYYYRRRDNGWSNAQSSDGSMLTGGPDQPTGVRMVLQFDAASSGFAGPLTRQILLGPK